MNMTVNIYAHLQNLNSQSAQYFFRPVLATDLKVYTEILGGKARHALRLW